MLSIGLAAGHLQAADLGHGARRHRRDEQDPRLRHLLRHGQRRRLVRADRRRQAAGDLLELRLHGGGHRHRSHAAHHDLLLQGAAAADRGDHARAEAQGHLHGPLRPAVPGVPRAARRLLLAAVLGVLQPAGPVRGQEPGHGPALHARFGRSSGLRSPTSSPRRTRTGRATDPGRDDLAQRLHHHDLPGLRLHLRQRFRPIPAFLVRPGHRRGRLRRSWDTPPSPPRRWSSWASSCSPSAR